MPAEKPTAAKGQPLEPLSLTQSIITSLLPISPIAESERRNKRIVDAWMRFHREAAPTYGLSIPADLQDFDQLVDRIHYFLRWIKRSSCLISVAARKLRTICLNVCMKFKAQKALRDASIGAVLSYWITEEKRLRDILQCKLIAEPWRQNENDSEYRQFSTLHIDDDEKWVVVKELYFRRRQETNRREVKHHQKLRSLRQRYFRMLALSVVSIRTSLSETKQILAMERTPPVKPSNQLLVNPYLASALKEDWGSLQEELTKAPTFEFSLATVSFDDLVNLWMELLPTLRLKFTRPVLKLARSPVVGCVPPLKLSKTPTAGIQGTPRLSRIDRRDRSPPHRLLPLRLTSMRRSSSSLSSNSAGRETPSSTRSSLSSFTTSTAVGTHQAPIMNTSQTWDALASLRNQRKEDSPKLLFTPRMRSSSSSSIPGSRHGQRRLSGLKVAPNLASLPAIDPLKGRPS